MRYRFTYIDEGNTVFVGSTPANWDKAVLGFERHPDFFSLVEFYKADLTAYGSNGDEDGARDFLLDAEDSFGPDSLITIKVEVDKEETDDWTILTTGILPISLFIESIDKSHTLKLVYSPNDFWSKFLSRYKSMVSINSNKNLDGVDVDPVNVKTLPLPSQIIRKKTEAQIVGDPLQTDSMQIADSVDNFLWYSFNKYPVRELENFIDEMPFQIDTNPPTDKLFYIYTPEEKCVLSIKAGSILRVSGNVLSNAVGVVPAPTSKITMQPFFRAKIGGILQPEVSFDAFQTNGHLSGVSTRFSVAFTAPADLTFDLDLGDQLYFYYKFTFSEVSVPGFPWFVIFDAHNPSDVTFIGETIATDTDTDAVLLHDHGYAIMDRITDSGLFYSPYLGNLDTKINYGAVGCGSNYMTMLGLHIRGYKMADKPFFTSFEKYWRGINPIFNLGLGPDKKDGQDIIKIAKKSEFMDNSGFSIILTNVIKIERDYDESLQFNEVQFGYTKWQSQSKGIGTPSGIDDPQTVRTFSTRLQRIGKPFKILSEFIAASLNIETVRRLGILESSNYTYDNDTYIIAVIKDGDNFVPELDENFSEIDNLNNSNKRYNLRLTCARNFLRWFNYVVIGLQDYVGSLIKFSSGEGNFAMKSKMATTCEGDDTGVLVDEQGTFTVDNSALCLARRYKIQHPMTLDQYETLRANRHKALGISQTDDEADAKKTHIMSLNYNFVHGTFNAVVQSKDKFRLTVPESDLTEQLDQQRWYDVPFEKPYE